jgi:hypothetical protein
MLLGDLGINAHTISRATLLDTVRALSLLLLPACPGWPCLRLPPANESKCEDRGPSHEKNLISD